MLSIHSSYNNNLIRITSCVLILTLSFYSLRLNAQEINDKEACIPVAIGVGTVFVSAWYVKHKIERYVDKLQKLDHNSKVIEIRKKITKFRDFANSLGCNISGRYLYNKIEKKLRKKNIDFDCYLLKSLFMSEKEMTQDEITKSLPDDAILEHVSKRFKNVYGSIGSDLKEDLVEIEIDGKVAVGAVLMGASVLIGAIGVVCPFVAPFTWTLAGVVAGTGLSMVMDGSCQHANRRKVGL